MKAGMSTSCLFGRDLLENNIDRMAEMGAQTIEVYLNTMSEYDAAFAKELRKRIDGNGMTVRSVHPHGIQYELQFYANYVRSQADAEDCYKRMLEAAAILGAEMTVYHGGFSVKQPKMRPNLSRVARVVTHCAEIAKGFGLKLAQENVHWTWFSMPEYAAQLQEIVESDNLYFTLDIKQAAQSKYPYEQYIKQMGNKIVNLHCCDYTLSDDNVVTTIPMRGSFDFAKLKKTLQAAGYDGPAILEVYPNDYGDFCELQEAFQQFSAVMND